LVWCWIAESVLVIGYVLLVFRLLQLGYKVLKGEESGFFQHNHDVIEDNMIEEAK